MDTNWSDAINDLTNLMHIDEHSARSKALNMLAPAAEQYGRYSREYLFLNHRLGIMHMLNAEYEEAEKFLLEALEISDNCEISTPELADITKHLTILYEAKARKAQ